MSNKFKGLGHKIFGKTVGFFNLAVRADPVYENKELKGFAVRFHDADPADHDVLSVELTPGVLQDFIDYLTEIAEQAPLKDRIER